MCKEVALEWQRSRVYTIHIVNNYLSKNQMSDVLPNYSKWQIEINTVIKKNPRRYLTMSQKSEMFPFQMLSILNVG